jgi:hypothetical protein
VSAYLVGAPGGGNPQTPSLTVTPTSLAFSATVGAGNPTSKTITVGNNGGGTLNFTASDSATWLSVSPGSGSAPKDVTVSVDTTGLAAGTYNANVTIDAGTATGSPKTVPVTLTLSAAGSSVKLAGADVIGTSTSQQTGRRAEAYRTTASSSGTATAARLYVDTGTTATELTMGVYADLGGEPSSLLGTGKIPAPTPGAWNEVPLAAGVTLTSGQPYWISLLSSGSGTLRWRDHAGGSGGPERTSASTTLTALPSTWLTSGSYSDGPASAYLVGAPPGPPPPPALSVAPASLSFSGVQGGSSPASKTLTVSNTGGGTLNFTASEAATWLSVSPASGSAPRDLTVAVDTSGLTAGTYNAQITIDAGTAQGSPKSIPVTLTVNPPAPPALSVSPASLSFSATQGGSSPAGQSLTIANTGGGSISFTATDDAAWLSESPTSGTAPASVTVTPNITGLAAGTYTATVTIDGGGVSGSPKTVPVTLTVSAPNSGLVGAWGFDEAGGTTTADRSGKANTGTISGATRSTAGKFGGALSFDGVNDWVTVPDANSLDLTAGMTLEAWVRPSATGTVWRTTLLKESSAGLVYGLYANTNTQRPSGHVFTSLETDIRGTATVPLNVWTHLATTYDGSVLRLYVNGVQVSTGAVSGSIATSANALRIGGNSIWNEWFKGLIDEVRVYDRALTAAQVQADMNAAVSSTVLSAARKTGASAKRRKISAAKLRHITSLRWERQHRGLPLRRHVSHRAPAIQVRHRK